MRRLSIQLDEGRISYQAGGDGQTLLLLHSLGVSSESWRLVMEPLGEKWSVYAWDMMGHGDSDKPPWNFRIEDYARTVSEFIDKLGVERVFLSGNSVGALVALEAAASYPERVKALVLVGCPAWDDWERIERLMLSALNYDIQGNPLPATREQLSMTYTHVTPELVDWVNSQRAKAGLWMKKTMIALGLYDIAPRLSRQVPRASHFRGERPASRRPADAA